jgi:hypothetical protein
MARLIWHGATLGALPKDVSSRSVHASGHILLLDLSHSGGQQAAVFSCIATFRTAMCAVCMQH